MTHGADVTEAGLELHEAEAPPIDHPLVALAYRAMQRINRWIMVPCMAAMVLAASILTYSVFARYFFKIPTDWQDETAVFLLIGAVFFSAAFVQSYRGHVGVEAITSLLSPRANRWRLLVVDLVSLAFCSFFAWKSWTLFLEAFHEGYRSNSTWGPPLWIPYVLMAFGMTLLSVQLLLAFATGLATKAGAGR